MNETKMEKLLKYLTSDEYDEYDDSKLITSGNSPWGGTAEDGTANNPVGVWGWDEDANEVVVGDCNDDMEIVSYDEARRIFN